MSDVVITTPTPARRRPAPLMTPSSLQQINYEHASVLSRPSMVENTPKVGIEPQPTPHPVPSPSIPRAAAIPLSTPPIPSTMEQEKLEISLSALQKELDVTGTELQKLKEESYRSNPEKMRELQRKLEQTCETVTAQTKTIEQLHEELALLKKEHEEMKKSTKDLEELHAKAKEEGNAAAAEHAQSEGKLQEQLAMKDQRIRELEETCTKLGQVEEKYQGLLQEQAAMSVAQQSLQEANEALHADIARGSEEAAILQETINKLQLEIMEQKKVEESQIGEVNRLQSQWEDVSAKLESEKNDLARSVERNSWLERRTQEQENRISNLEDKLEGQLAKEAEWMGKEQQWSTESKALQAEIEALKEEQQQAIADLHAYQTEMQDIMQDKAQAEEEVGELKLSMRHLESLGRGDEEALDGAWKQCKLMMDSFERCRNLRIMKGLRALAPVAHMYEEGERTVLEPVTPLRG